MTDPAGLVGRDWLVAEVAGTPAPDDDPPSLRFDPDGRVSGSTGINRLAGDYELVGGVVTVGPLALTRMAGPPDRMELESAVVAALGSELGVVAEGDGVRLGAGSGLLLRPAAPSG